MRVAQAGQCLGFAFESRLQFGIAREALRQNFDGNEPVEPAVFCLVDLTLSTGTKR